MTNIQLLLFASDLGVQCCIVPIVAILIYFGLEAYNRQKRERREQEERDAAEESAQIRWELQKGEEERFIDSSTELFNSANYKLVEQFSKKFFSQLPEREVENLRSVLALKGYAFSSAEMSRLIDIEQRRQRGFELRRKILSSEPFGARSIIREYLNFASADDMEMTEVLRDILEERSLFGLFDSKIGNLRAEVRKVERELELENFERRLVDEDPVVSLADIDLMTGYQFEEFLRELFVRMGYSVVQTKLSGDQGADIVAEKSGERTVVQAKRFGGKVGNYAVQEIVAAMSLYEAHSGKVITNSYFTRSAEELAGANDIHLVDRDELESLVNSYW